MRRGRGSGCRCSARGSRFSRSCSRSASSRRAPSPPPAFEEVPPAEELYAKGQKILEGERWLGIIPHTDYTKAIETFQAIIDNYPYSDYAIQAELAIADAYFEDEKYEEALSYYRDFGDLHPQHEKVPYTLFQAALCHERRKRSAEPRPDPDARRAGLPRSAALEASPLDAGDRGRGALARSAAAARGAGPRDRRVLHEAGRVGERRGSLAHAAQRVPGPRPRRARPSTSSPCVTRR